MSDFVFAIRFKAGGTAEVVSAAAAVEGATARVGRAGEEAGRKIKASADQAGAAQARVTRETDDLRATFAQLEALKPFAQNGGDALGLERALAAVTAAIKGQMDGATAASLANEQFLRLLGEGAPTAEGLRRELVALEALKPFAQTGKEALLLEGALARVRAELATVDQATRRDAEAFRALRDRLDPAAVSARDLAASQALLDRVLAGSVPGVRLTEAQHAALTKTLRDQHGVIDAGTGKVRLAGWQMQQLGMQVQDAGVQLMGGQNPFLILAQQAPQAAGAVGGFGNMLRLLVTPVAGVVAGVGALAGAAAMVGTRIAEISAEARTLNTALRALNPELTVTAESMRLMAFSIADQTGASRQDVGGALLTAAKNRAIRDVGLLRDIAAVAQDVAAVTGEAASAVAAKIAGAYAKGAAGIAQLDEELGFLTRGQAEHVRLLDEQGRRMEALGVATAALKERFGGAVTAMRSEWGNAFHEMGRAWDDFVEKIAQTDFSRALARGLAQVGTGVQWWINGVPGEIQRATEMASVQKALDDKTAQLEAAISGGARGRGVDLLRRQVTELQKRYYALAEAVNAPPPASGSAPTPSAPGYAPGGGRQQLPRAGAITDDEGKRLDAAAEANERYFKALQKVGAERQIAQAGAQAYEEALRRGDGREARLEAAAQAETRARKELGAAIADQTAQYSLQVRGLLGVADAYGQSAAAAVVAQARAQALTDSLQSGADVEARTRELVLQGAAQQAAAIAQSTDAMKLEVEWTERIAAATADGVAARDEATRQADVARQTSQVLAHAQAAEAMGDAELAKKLRALAAGYDETSKALARAKQMAAGAEAIRTSKADLEYARAELGLMREAEPVRERALASLRIQRQAMELFKDVSTDALRQQRDEWIALQEQIADVQVLKQFEQQVKAVSEDVSRDVAEALYDRLMDPDKATSVVDFFKSIFKRLAVEALKTKIVMPIVSQVVGAAPGLFGIQAPAAGAASYQLTPNGAGGFSLTGAAQQAGQSWLSNKLFGQAGFSGWLDDLGYGLGIGTPAMTLAPTAGVQAAQIAALQAANPQLTAAQIAAAYQAPTAGTAAVGLSSYLGAFGAGSLAGGLLGGWLGTAANSKLVGGLSGAAAGAGAGALAGSFLFPGVGTVLGALLGGGGGLLGGLLGTAKKSSNYGGAVVVTNPDLTVAERASGADRTVDVGPLVQAADGIQQLVTSTIKAAGLTLDGKLWTGFQTENGRVATKLGGWDGKVVSTSDDPRQIAVDVLRHLATASAGTPGVPTLSGDQNVLTALRNSKATDAETLAKHLDFAKSFDDSVAAMTATRGLENAAAKAGKQAADDLAKSLTEFRQTTRDLGLDVGAADRGTRAWVDGMIQGAEPQTYTETEAAVAQLKAQWEAMSPVLLAVGYTADEAGRKIQEGLTNNLARLQRSFQEQARDRIEALEGRGYLKSVRDIDAARDTARRNEDALGLDHSASQREYELSLQQALRGLSAQQLADVARTVGGAVADLVRQMEQSALSADRTTLELGARLLDAQAAVGQVPAKAANDNRIAVQRALELADAESDLVRARLQAIYALEDEGRALETARQQRDAAADLYGRGLTLMGDDRGAALVRYDLQAAQEMERSVAAGGNLALLGTIQAAERARVVADALRQDLLTAIDRQAKAVSENTAAQREVAQKWGQLTSLSTSADTALTGSSSNLNDWDKLVEARRQFEVALATWNDTGLSDDVRFAAAGRLQALGQARIDAAKGWYGGTDSSDFARVTGVWKALGDTAQQQVDAAQTQIAINERQLKSLEDARKSAESLGERQIGSIETLTGLTSDAFASLTSAVNAVTAAVRTSVGTTAPNPVPVVAPVLTPEQRYLAANPDVANGIAGGWKINGAPVTAAQHYAMWGWREGRDGYGMSLTREQQYLQRYPDIAEAVANGYFSSGADHYERFGQFEGRTFAQGGVMTPWGELPLTRRADGGVATSPTLTVYGEGDRPEAFVPLPDGRTIPVTVRFPTAAPVADSAGTRRVADLLGEQNGLMRAVLAEMERNTRTTASAGAQAASEARQARALAARQIAMQERIGLRRVA